MSRFYSRHGDGRFRHATMENTFGLKVWICAECNGCCPTGTGEAKPETCHHCGRPFRDIEEQPGRTTP